MIPQPHPCKWRGSTPLLRSVLLVLTTSLTAVAAPDLQEEAAYDTEAFAAIDNLRLDPAKACKSLNALVARSEPPPLYWTQWVHRAQGNCEEVDGHFSEAVEAYTQGLAVAEGVIAHSAAKPEQCTGEEIRTKTKSEACAVALAQQNIALLPGFIQRAQGQLPLDTADPPPVVDPPVTKDAPPLVQRAKRQVRPKPVIEAVRQDRVRWLRWLGAGTAVAGVSALAAGGYYLGKAVGQKSGFQQVCPDAECRDAAGIALNNQSVRSADRATWLTGLGLFSSIAGATLLSLSLDGKERGQKVQAVAQIMPTTLGGRIVLKGSF